MSFLFRFVMSLLEFGGWLFFIFGFMAIFETMPHSARISGRGVLGTRANTGELHFVNLGQPSGSARQRKDQ